MTQTEHLPDIRFIPIEPSLADLLREDRAMFEASYSVRVGQQFDAVLRSAQQTLEHVPRHEDHAPWCGYLTVAEDQESIVGTCAFKHVPDKNREVEIAYNTYPTFENQGFARAMVQKLVEIARESKAVRAVTAHTLPGPNASTRVLTSRGFRHIDEHEDGDDGLVWRWRLSLDES